MEDNILEMFLEDTREHLAGIETDLLDIEEANPDFDPELVNKVFRTAHSIKGSAGFLALDNIRDLAHKIENVLDLMRCRELQPTSDVIGIVLRCFDRLQDLVDNVQESDSMDISDQVAMLTALVQSGLPEESKADVTKPANIDLPVGRDLFTLSEYDLKQARKGGNFIYMVEYDLIHDVHRLDKTPFDLLRNLEKSGLILDCRMDLRAVGDLEGEFSNRLPFYVLYATILEPELCKAIFQVDEKYIHHIEEGSEPQPQETSSQTSNERKPVSADDLDALERELDLAMSSRTASGGNVEPLTPHPSLMSGFDTPENPQAPELEDNPASPPEEAAELTVAPAPEESPDEAPAEVLDGEDAAAPAMGASDAAPFEVSGEFYSLSGAGKSGTLFLHGKATIENGAALKNALLQGLDRCEELTLDLAQVEEADIALLQLLFAARHSAKSRGRSFIVADQVPEPVLDVANRAGLSHRMQDGFQGIFKS